MKTPLLSVVLVAFAIASLHAQLLTISLRQDLLSMPTAVALQTYTFDDAAAEGNLRKVLVARIKSFPLPNVEAGRTVVASFGAATPGADDLLLGIDIAAQPETPVLAAGSGVMAQTGYTDDFGLFVVVDHGNFLKTIYAHLSRFSAKRKGDAVGLGEVIGHAGLTGLTTEPVLYFAIRYVEQYVNPALALDRFNQLN